MSSLDYVNVLKNFFPMEICLSSRFQSPALWPGMTHFMPMLSQNERCRRGAWCNSLSFDTFLSSNGNFLGGSDHKPSAYNAGDPDSIPTSGRSPGEGNGNPLQYSCLEIPMDGGTW